MEGHPHPYVPKDLKLPGYVPVSLSQSTILSVYGIASALVVSIVWILSEFYKDKSSCYLAQVWKEYSKGDSRYAARDAGIVTVEGLTAVIEGPASLLAVYAIATRKSYSYILQFAISLGQLYGDAVYFITSFLEGDNFATNPFYYYAYYVGANSSWVVIPLLIAIRCWKNICRAFHIQGQKKTKTR